MKSQTFQLILISDSGKKFSTSQDSTTGWLQRKENHLHEQNKNNRESGNQDNIINNQESSFAFQQQQTNREDYKVKRKKQLGQNKTTNSSSSFFFFFLYRHQSRNQLKLSQIYTIWHRFPDTFAEPVLYLSHPLPSCLFSAAELKMSPWLLLQWTCIASCREAGQNKNFCHWIKWNGMDQLSMLSFALSLSLQFFFASWNPLVGTKSCQIGGGGWLVGEKEAISSTQDAVRVRNRGISRVISVFVSTYCGREMK